MSKRLLFHLGIAICIVSIMFGFVSLNYSVVTRGVMIVRTPESMTRVPTSDVTYPLAGIHFLTYCLLAPGLVMVYSSYRGEFNTVLRANLKLVSGTFIGFGSALSIIVYTAWDILLASIASEYFIVREAKVMRVAELATNIAVPLGILLVVAGLGLEIIGRWKRTGG